MTATELYDLLLAELARLNGVNYLYEVTAFLKGPQAAAPYAHTNEVHEVRGMLAGGIVLVATFLDRGRPPAVFALGHSTKMPNWTRPVTREEMDGYPNSAGERRSWEISGPPWYGLAPYPVPETIKVDNRHEK